MNKTELGIFVKSLTQECEVKEGRQFAEVTIPASALHALAVQLKEKEESSFDFLVSITGVDYGQDLGAVYHLRSTKHEHMIVLKVRTNDRENPHFDTVTDIWKSADIKLWPFKVESGPDDKPLIVVQYKGETKKF